MTTESDVLAIVKAFVGEADLDEAIERVHRLDDEPRVRAWLAAGLISTLSRHRPGNTVVAWTERAVVLDGLLKLADSDVLPDDQRRALRAAVGGMNVMRAAAEGSLTDPVQALDDLRKAHGEAPDHPGAVLMTELARQMVTLERDLDSGDEDAYRHAEREFQRIREQAAAQQPELVPHLEFVGRFLHTMAKADSPREQMALLLTECAPMLDDLPLDGPLRAAFDDMRAMAQGLGPSVVPGQIVPEPGADPMAELAERARQPGITPALRANLLLAAGGASLQEWKAVDAARITRGLECYREAAELAVRGRKDWFLAVTGAAMALWRRHEVTNNPADLRAAEEILQDARDVAGDPQHASWNLVNTMLSEIERLLGKDGVETALATVRGVAWRVLRQSDAAAARRVAEEAVEDTVRSARRSLIDGDPATAIRVLDGGRALMLFAATEFRDVENRLLAAGRPDLADRWRAAEDDDGRDRLPTSLRYEVLSVFAQRSGLLDTPDLAEIRSALRAVDADALVYLLPADGITPGFAVMAAAHAAPSYIPLPGLAVDGDSDVNRYLGSLARRDADPAGPDAGADSAGRDADPAEPDPGADLTGSLDAVSDWAWRAAIGPLVEQYLPTLPAPAGDRPRRLVLVPMGELALIPWQAARRGDGVPALRLAAFSQTASARMLCRSAQAAPVPLTPVGLVVGDPDTGVRWQALAGARIEAFAVHQAFYRAGKYVGRRADGSASPAGAGSVQQVRDWLADPRPAAGAMLHLACHGVVESGGPAPTSYLLLADGGRLTAEEIVALLLDTPQRAIGLAVLAACHTGRSVHGYDEAYSLGTAFLAGGVRSVLSAQWAVPDAATSALMFMFHHHLVAGRLPAWEALRRAQLWMLDADREAPATMPAALRRRLSGADLARTEAWAGFIHLGR
ncbi:CHAT domain-containing protein [Catenulispora subtropica]|uniref:CHAT domain-containing protein n=1 Tax=Catenulispora subtropica TaxID=450798 RepID=A0ABN2T2T8_9ACTN